METETVWFLENLDDSTWLCKIDKYFYSKYGYTNDPNKAIKFRTEEDANKFITHKMDKELIPTEHMFMDMPSDIEEIYEQYIGDGVMGVDFEKKHILEAMEAYANQQKGDFWKPMCIACNETVDKCKCNQQKQVSDEKELLIDYGKYFAKAIADAQPNSYESLADEYLKAHVKQECERCQGTGRDGHDRCAPPSWYVCEDCNGTGIATKQVSEYKCADCGAEMNEGEASTFTVCDDCWEKAYPKKDKQKESKKWRDKLNK